MPSDVLMPQARRAAGTPALPTLPHRGWYAVALSAEVAPGTVRGAPFLGGRLALYRRRDGSPVALAATCPHMGADLAAGDVVDDELRCMFHHFRYGADGRCTAIPSGQRPPRAAAVHSFPVADRWGLVWAFNGEGQPPPPPGIRGYDDADLEVRARRTDMFEVAPWVILANSFDYQHLRYVHQLVFDFDERTIRWSADQVEYDMTFTTPDDLEISQRIRVTGANTVSYVTDGEVDSMGLFTVTPVGTGTQSWYVAATPRAAGGDADARLDLQEKLADDLLRDDTRAFAGMRFRQGAFVAEDRSIARYLRYVRDLPTFDPSGWLD